MRIYEEKNYENLSLRAAGLMAAEIIKKPECVLGLATGSTPIGTYEELCRKYQAGIISFRQVTTINLDEYLGIPSEHSQSYRHFMEKHLFSHIDIKRENTFVPDGLPTDAEWECTAYDAFIQSIGYADLQLLGIGRNGHIGFNEPGLSFIKETHVVDLAEDTVLANSRFFECLDQVPRQAITMGIGAIMAAKRVLLIASGEEKAEALHAALCGPITPACPASILQVHPDLVVVGDEAGLSKVPEEVKRCR